MNWKKSLTALFLVLFIQQGHAQLDRYKYIVVPLQFEGFKKVNQFRTSTLIKLLFTQEGYNTVYDDKIPVELATKPCLGLEVRLVDDSSLFLTRIKLALVDCYGQVVFETPEGKSKIKEYEPAYREAIEGAFAVLVGTGHAYNPTEAATEKGPVRPPTQAERLLNPPAKKAEPAAVGAVAAAVSTEKAVSSGKDSQTPELWYAQPVDNGFQLVDSTPSVRMRLVTTTQENTFIAMVDEAPMGMVYMKDGQWWHEFYEKGKVQSRRLNIKF
ncbi:MAG: hypothetical protein ACO20F_09515 [Robiginitalea sp.]|jgi:hypothetical protein